MAKPVIRYGVVSCPDFTSPTGPVGQVFGAMDDASGGAFIHEGVEYWIIAGGTNNMHTEPTSVYNDTWVSTDRGLTWETHQAPWTVRNAICFAQTNVGFDTARVIYIGGQPAQVDGQIEVWYFDHAGWHNTTMNANGIQGDYGFPDIVYDDETRALYLIPGLQADGRIMKSFDGGANWEYHSMVADEMIGLGQRAFCQFKGCWYAAGGEETIGMLHKSADKGLTWQLIETSFEKYAYLWPDMGACKDFLFYQRGGRVAGSAIGHKGSMYMTNIDTNEMVPFVGIERNGCHASTIYADALGKGVIFVMGNMHAEVGYVRDIAKYED